MYKCVGRSCVRFGPPGGKAYNSSACNGECAASAPPLTSLAPLPMRMLAVGAVRPAGWLQRQLATQVNGLSGHLARFWPDVRNSTWLHPENRWQETYSDRGGNLPYWLNGVLPMVMQVRELSDRVDSTGYNLTSVACDYMLRLVAKQRAAGTMLRNFNLGTWNIVRSALLLMSAVPRETPSLLPFVLAYVNASHARLKAEGWGSNTLCTACDEYNPNCSRIEGGGYCRFRYPDWMHILTELLDAHESQMSAAEAALVYEHMELIGAWGFDYRAFYGHECDTNDSSAVVPCFPTGGCNSGHVAEGTGCSTPAWFRTSPLDVPAVHGVHGGAMALKEGTVRWRMTRAERDVELVARKVELLERYQGQPTGQFSADEHFAGRAARRGVELCTIVETMYSLGVMGQNGSVALIDRLERIGLNALPAALTADMWSHNYLSMVNEVQAVQSHAHQWGDGENATTYGLADRFTGVTPCCTANHNQGWPKLVRFAVQADLRPGQEAIYVALLLPTNATMPEAVGGGAVVAVETAYPFGDTVTVRVTAAWAVRLFVRVPSWAGNASATLGDGPARGTVAGAYHLARCAAGTTVLTLSLNPKIVVERHWGGDGANGVAVTRGPLLFALPLDETTTRLGSPYDTCFESGCSHDVQITSTAQWAYALVLPRGTAPNSTIVDPGWTFERLGPPGIHPFAGLASPTVAIVAKARQLASWTMDSKFVNAPQELPPSPVDCSSAELCGPLESVQLVPFGSTRLRIGMLPYTSDSFLGEK